MEQRDTRWGEQALTVRPLLFCTCLLKGGGCSLEQGGVGYNGNVSTYIRILSQGKHWCNIATWSVLGHPLPGLGTDLRTQMVTGNKTKRSGVHSNMLHLPASPPPHSTLPHHRGPRRGHCSNQLVPHSGLQGTGAAMHHTSEATCDRRGSSLALGGVGTSSVGLCHCRQAQTTHNALYVLHVYKYCIHHYNRWNTCTVNVVDQCMYEVVDTHNAAVTASPKHHSTN